MNKHTLICIAFSCITIGDLRADHFTGGYITYECIGSNYYEVTMYVIRDCSFGTTLVPTEVTLNLINAETGMLAATYTLPLYSGPSISFCYVTPCEAAGTHCYEPYAYREFITLPTSSAPQGYWLTYSSCCRNAAITNISNPMAQGVRYYCRVADPVTYICNSAPVFMDWPHCYACVDRPFALDHSAFDSDGDSLSYTFCPALASGGPPIPPWPSVIYDSPFSGSYPLAALPSFSIDPVTGVIAGTPTAAGHWQLNICIEEWRNDVMIGEHHREWQLNVVPDCSLPHAQVGGTGPIVLCVGDSVEFENASSNAFMFHWDFGTGNPMDTSILVNPIFAYQYPGLYVVRLVANQLSSCADTTYQTVVVGPGPPSIQTAPDTTICSGAQTRLFATGMGSFTWSPGASLDNDTVFNPIASPLATTTYTVVLDISPNCVATDSVTVTVLPPVAVSLSGLQPSYLTPDDPDTLAGSPPGGTFSGPGITDSIFDPAAAGVGTHTVYYTYIDTNGCNGADSMTTVVNAPSGAEPVPAGLQLRVQPNPSDGRFNVKLDTRHPVSFTIRILDVHGRVVEERIIEASTQLNQSFSIHSVSGGLYNVHVIWEDGNAQQRLVIF